MKKLGFTLLALLLASISINSYSQDIKGGFLTAETSSGNIIDFYVVLYVGEENIDRPVIGFGEFSLNFVGDTQLSEDLIMKEYSGTSTLPGVGMHSYTLEENYRIAIIDNISNAEAQPLMLSLESGMHPQAGYSDLPEPTNTPDQITVENGTYTFDPGFENTNPDEDLVFSLVNCGAEDYEMPAGLEVDDSGVITFTPQSQGNYSVCLQVEKLIDGISVGEMNMEILFEANDASVSVEEKVGDLKIYPNPSTNLLFVDIPLNGSEWNYSLIDLAGRVVKEGKLAESNNQIEVKQLQKSIYLLQLSNKSETFTKKVIVGN